MNRLSKESSPYLLQHKDNPVDWYAWGNLAFGEAQRLDRPILLSIGYSACHWCHVMAHESFEDLATARLMNSLFINIKVDREERPDIDHIYMNFVQMSTGSGGWPLTVFLTPDLVPFYGGTYFPPEERFGRMGFKDLLRVISDTYKFRKDEITEKKGEILEALAGSGRLEAQRPEAQKSKAHRPATQGDPSDAPAEKPDGLSAPDFETCFTTISSIYDARHGGFYNAPKFPMPSLHFFLLHHYAATSREAPLEMVENTLDSMAQGGIYDHAGGGFHRYATDNHWMIPHFEKMLYDNALLMQLYTDAFRITKHKRYLEIAEETARFLMRDMKDAGSGGYYSSLDADSEGQEGIYYTYDYNELHKYLDADELALAEKHFGVIKDGNFEGRNILHTSFSPDDMTGRLLKSASELKGKLLSLRQKRTPPGLDTKILVSWNALLARSFALLYAVTGSGRYLAEAEGIARLILDNCFDNGRLCHSYRKDDTVIEGMLDDYAFSSEALLTLFEVTQKEGYLHASVSLMEALLKEFYSPDENEFFFTHSSQSNLIVRPVNAFDNSILSGNSSAVITLIRLSAITGNTEYIQTAGKYITARRALLKSEPQNYSYLLCASYLYSLTPAEVAFIASDEESIPRFISEFFGHYFPFASVAASVDARDTKVGLLEGKRALSGLNTYYLCRNFACSSPVHDFSELKEILESKSR